MLVRERLEIYRSRGILPTFICSRILRPAQLFVNCYFVVSRPEIVCRLKLEAIDKLCNYLKIKYDVIFKLFFLYFFSIYLEHAYVHIYQLTVKIDSGKIISRVNKFNLYNLSKNRTLMLILCSYFWRKTKWLS